MAIDLVELIRLKVTSIVMEGETTNLFEKENALNQFYPILLSILSAKPQLVSSLMNQLNPRLSDLFGTNPTLKNEFLEQVRGSAETNDIENTLNASILPTLSLLQNEAESSDADAVSDYLNQNASSIQRTLPNWATTFLTALGVGAVSEPVEHAQSEPTPEMDNILLDDAAKTNKWLPIIALLIGLAILGLLFKACSEQKPKQVEVVNTQ